MAWQLLHFASTRALPSLAGACAQAGAADDATKHEIAVMRNRAVLKAAPLSVK
jgi:hypothetical protein